MSGLDLAVTGLEQALERSRKPAMWRRLVRHRVGKVRDALLADDPPTGDAWLAPREASIRRERDTLLARIDHASVQLLTVAEDDRLWPDLRRLAADLRRHVQHLNDLVYDTVSLELGGSE